MIAKSSTPSLIVYLASYAAWLGLAAFGFVLVSQINATLFGVAVWLRLNAWQVRAVDQFGIVLLGLLWLVGVILLEHMLRRRLQQQRAAAFLGRVLLGQLLVLAICYLLQALLATASVPTL